MTVRLGNSGRSAAVFHVRSQSLPNGPWTYTVGPDTSVSETWSIQTDGPDAYDLSVHGPNGFLRAFKGSVSIQEETRLAVRSFYHADAARPGITLDVHNRGAAASEVRISDAYTKKVMVHSVAPDRSLTWHFPLDASFGWYDFMIEVESDQTFVQQLAGHVETGADSFSDPAIGA